MSWIIQNLLRNYEQSKTDVDSYDRLLSVEKIISELFRKGLLTEKDLYIIKKVVEGIPLEAIADTMGVSRVTVSRYFNTLCRKLGFFLGGEFTDIGYLQYMKEKYNFDESDIDILREFIVGRAKTKLIRKGKK